MEQQQASEDALMTRIGQAIMLLHGGDREEARNRFGEIWTELGEAGNAFQRCTLAHYMADTQDDPGDELAWDLRALTAADTDRPGAAVRGFYPSLHLNLAADYVKLRRPEAARLHLDEARAAAADVLGDDGYGNGVRAAIDRLELRLREV
ncbi:tetratricopeptide repeat protein [Streptomyces sp. 150FB]|uniref:tetratricopeptide repeat protein n=1 Tax=Streptomyces sp. 150FB TaxID=1576605 RepID=UPI00058951AA|nr:tetratricopeptide repeat protein [Streptomyces sp. 150FB]KIF73389.1 tetratricopeptide repeat protein [Streptomyces sp. 150FB]